MRKTTDERIGVIIVLACGIVWGLSGVMSQILFSSSDMTAEWLVVLRMSIAGFSILVYKVCKTGKDVFRILKNGRDFCRFFIYMMSIMLMQFSYSKAIQTSNAATATVLQYTYPVFILLFTAFEKKKMPRLYESIAVFFAFTGVYLIATHGRPYTLQITKEALFWGIVSSLAFVVYTVYPKKMYEKYDGACMLGLAMFFDSFIMLSVTGCYHKLFAVTQKVVILTGIITLFGCMIPLITYNIGVRKLGNVRASLFVTVEPVFCALAAAVLGISKFEKIDVVGFLLILIPVEAVAVMSFKNGDLSKKQ